MPASVYGISKDTTSTDAAKMQQHAYENDDISEEIFEQALADVVGEEQFEILEEPIISNPSEMNIETVTEAQISDLKNRLKKIGNRRAMAIASKLSSGGNHQDQRLREAEKHLTKIDIEIKRIENISARSTAVSNSNTSSKGTSKMKNNKVNPSLQADLHNATSMLVDSGMVTYPIAELKELLKEMKEEAKADVNQFEVHVVVALFILFCNIIFCRLNSIA